jgi:hypothetical protein
MKVDPVSNSTYEALKPQHEKDADFLEKLDYSDKQYITDNIMEIIRIEARYKEWQKTNGAAADKANADNKKATKSSDTDTATASAAADKTDAKKVCKNIALIPNDYLINFLRICALMYS